MTGTDTGVGKTTVGVALLHFFRGRGLTTAAIKPVATGCMPSGSSWISEDQQQLQAAATFKQEGMPPSPFYFEPPTAPSIAAALIGCVISAKKVTHYVQGILRSLFCDVVLVEGIGGWLIPLNEHESMADVALQLGFPAILVVGMRLGCINHALLTYESIRAKGIKCAGWVANGMDPTMIYVEKTMGIIKSSMPVPCLGVLPYHAQQFRPFAPILGNL